MALAPEMLPLDPVVVSVLEVRLQTTVTSPVTMPPVFAFSELLARVNTAVMELFCVKSTPTLSSPISHLGTYFFSLKKSSPISVANETGGITWRSLLTVSSCASTEKDHSSKTFSFFSLNYV